MKVKRHCKQHEHTMFKLRELGVAKKISTWLYLSKFLAEFTLSLCPILSHFSISFFLGLTQPCCLSWQTGKQFHPLNSQCFLQKRTSIYCFELLPASQTWDQLLLVTSGYTTGFFLTPTPLTTSPQTLITGAGGVLLLSWATHPIKGLKIWHYCLWILAALNLWIHKHNENFLPVRLWLWIWCDGTEHLPDLKKDTLHNTQVLFRFSSLFRNYIQLQNLAPTDWC
jgi:hypothetical protein